MRSIPLLPSAAATLAALSLGVPCVAQHWRSISPPAARYDHALAFDSWRSQTVMYGGRSPANYGLEDTWVFDGARWHGVPTLISPGRRCMHAMAFDASRGVTVLFGGLHPNGTRLGDTWEFDGTSWTLIMTPVAPSPRMASAMAYVPGHGVVLFGGHDGVHRDDTWVYNNVAGWTQPPIASSPSPARYRHAMAGDAFGHAVLFGGQAPNGTRLPDTWELDLTVTPATWTQKPLPTAPSARWGHGMTYDSGRNVTILFGGNDGNYRNDLWEYNGTWTQRSPGPPLPAGRYSSPLAFDTRLGQAVLFGGQTQAGTAADTWLYDGVATAWTQVPRATEPPPRITGAVFDGARHRFVQFGGMRVLSSGRTLFNDTWELVGDWTWTQVPTANAPSPRTYPGMAYDARIGRIVLFGGGIWTGAPWTTLNDTWVYDGTDWSQVSVTGPSPSTRGGMSFAYDPRRGRTVLFGGQAFVNGAWVVYGDTWEYDGVARTWTQIATPIAPPPRSALSMAYDARRGVMVLFGGGDSQTLSNDTWEYDGATGTWTQIPIPSSSAPSARWAPLVYDAARGVCLLFGGYTPTGVLDDTWEYDGTGWTRVMIPGPSPRANHAMVYDPNRGETLVLWGSSGGVARNQDDAWAFVPAPAARWTSYGFGCAGSNGTPQLTNATLPQLGTSLQLDVGNLPTAGGLVFLAHGFDLTATGGVALPLDLAALPRCQLWIDPVVAGGLQHVGGSASFTLPIPNVAALAGRLFSSQALSVDPAAPNGIGAMSNAGIATVN